MADNDDLDDIDEFNEEASKPLPPKPPIEWVLWLTIMRVRENPNPNGYATKILKKQELPDDAIWIGKNERTGMDRYCDEDYLLNVHFTGRKTN